MNPLKLALASSTHALCYELGRLLEEQSKGRHVLECSSAQSILEFARAGQAEVTAHEDAHSEIVTEWRSRGEPSRRAAKNAWFKVQWQEHELEVVTVSWSESYRDRARAWVIADSANVALSFYETLAEWADEVRGEILVFRGGCFRKSADLYRAVHNSSFDSLVLEDALKNTIRHDFRRFLSSRDQYERLGVPWKRGALLLGPPGNGKTHCVKALVKELDIPCLYVTSFKARYEDDDSMVAKVFDRARRTTPCLLVLEDLDSLLTRNNRAYFLNELDGFAENTGIITLATTNYPERLDPSLLERPSRFDVKYHFELPTSDLRQTYVTQRFAHLEAPLAPSEQDCAWIAEHTEGFSYAFLKELCVSVLLDLVVDGGSSLRTAAERRVDGLRQQLGSESSPQRPSPDREDDNNA